MLKKLIVFGVCTVSLGVMIGLNRCRWVVLSGIGFYPSDICSIEKPTQEYKEYLGYEVSENFFARGGEINQRVVDRIKQNNKCSLDFLLYFALLNQELNSAKLLLENGAVIRKGIDFHSGLYERRPNPLFYFVEDADTVRDLIARGADVNAINEYGHTPLYFSRSRAVVQTLIDNGTDLDRKQEYTQIPLVYAIDEYSKNPLFYAANKEVAQALIDNGVEVNAVDRNGMTPLFYAANKEVAQVLIDNGADVNAVDRNGMTPISMPMREGYRYTDLDSKYDYDYSTIKRDLIEVPIDNGAELNPPAQDRHKTFLIDAVLSQYKTDFELIQLLLDNGADVNARDKAGRTALFYVRNVVGIQLLLDNGADVRVRDNDGRTVLFYEIYDPETIDLLLDRGVDINARDDFGKTPLELALSDGINYGSFKWAQLLIDYGAKLNVKDSNGKTLLSKTTNKKARQLLIDNGADANAQDDDR